MVGPLDDNEHFMVWMRVGSRATVRKLYGIIRHDIPKGPRSRYRAIGMRRDVWDTGSKLTFSITHRYNTYGFDGQKRLILSTSNWTGGKNTVIGIPATLGNGAVADRVLVPCRGCLFRYRCAFSRRMHLHSGTGSEIQSKARRLERALLEQGRKKGVLKDRCGSLVVGLHC